MSARESTIWISPPTECTSAIVEARLICGPYDGTFVRLDPGEMARMFIYLPLPGHCYDDEPPLWLPDENMTKAIMYRPFVRYRLVLQPVCDLDFRLRYVFD